MAEQEFRHPDVQHYLPLKPVVFHILLALAERDLHGYGVIRSVRDRSEGQIHLQTGPFYRHLKKLMDTGLVVDTKSPALEDDPRRGAYYRLSQLGKRVVGAEAQRLAVLVSATEALGLLDGRSAP